MMVILDMMKKKKMLMKSKAMSDTAVLMMSEKNIYSFSNSSYVEKWLA
jgi:hypothetical protein